MKIGIDLKYIRNPHEKGNLGDERVQRNVIQHLARLGNEHEFSLYFNPHVDVDALGVSFGPNMRIVKMPVYHRNAILRNTISFPIELHRHPVDVFHGSASLPLFFKGKKVMSMWEFSPILFPEYFPSYVNVSRKYAYQKSVRRADCIITATEFIKKEIVSFFGVPPDKVATIPLGIEERFFVRHDAQTLDRIRSKYEIPGPYVLAVGNLYPKKNIARLIQAFNLLKSERACAESLVVVGSALWKTDDIGSLDLTHTHFAGYVQDDDLPALYQGSTMFVFPSLYEGFGIPVLEAMASEVPMVLSGNTSFPELARDSALYYDPFDIDSIRDGMEQVLDNTTLRQSLVARGKKRVQEYQWHDVARKYYDLYGSL